jgi:N,N-dimethylformamidase
MARPTLRRIANFTALSAAAVVACVNAPQPSAAALEAWFTERSYAPGTAATLRISASSPSIGIQLFHAGEELQPTTRPDVMEGVPVGDVITLRAARGLERSLRIRLHYWDSGLYFARVRAGGGTAYAPFVLRSRKLGYRRIAIVLPTNTWQAYNVRDDDGDGVGDSWYADETNTTVQLTRPFANRGVPPHYANYDLGFLRWLERSRIEADFLTDDDLERLRGEQLGRAYDLVVFSGHHEYVTPHVYDAIERYRDLGGNLIFLSANNFFYRVERHGDTIVRTQRWRDIGRPEAALIGVQYIGWYEEKYENAGYVASGTDAAPWFFEDAGIRTGDRFGSFGIEIDARTEQSPPGTQVLATIPDVFGPGQSAEMVFYETGAGARVFAAGVLNFGGAALIPPVPMLLANLWARWSTP